MKKLKSAENPSTVLPDLPLLSPVLHDHGVHFLSGEINIETSSAAIEWILEANLSQEYSHKFLTLIINSPGGSFEDGFALVDIMAGSKIPVRTVGVGIIASMGLLLFIAGQNGYRTLTPNCLILSHQWSGVSSGKEHELVASQKEHGIITGTVIRHYKKYTGMKEKDIRKHLLPSHDVWLTAEEARKLNLCDVVKLV